MSDNRIAVITSSPSAEQIAKAVARVEPALPEGVDPGTARKPLPPTAPLTRNLIFTGGTYLRNARMPEKEASHKTQRAILANNIFVQLSHEKPEMSRHERKRLAKKLARERVAALLKRRQASTQELDALREQDFAEAKPPEGWR